MTPPNPDAKIRRVWEVIAPCEMKLGFCRDDFIISADDLRKVKGLIERYWENSTSTEFKGDLPEVLQILEERRYFQDED